MTPNLSLLVLFGQRALSFVGSSNRLVIMPRVFACLAVANMIVLVLTAALGLVRGGMPVDVHILVGVFSLLVSCFVQVVVFMYISVTGKAMAQAVHLGHLDIAPLVALRNTKRRVVHAMAMVLVGVIGLIATGAVHWQSGEWLAAHTLVAMVVFVLHGMAFWRQFGLVVAHGASVSRVLGAYQRPGGVTRGGGG